MPVYPQPGFHLNKIVLRPLVSFSRGEDSPLHPLKSLWLLPIPLKVTAVSTWRPQVPCVGRSLLWLEIQKRDSVVPFLWEASI